MVTPSSYPAMWMAFFYVDDGFAQVKPWFTRKAYKARSSWTSITRCLRRKAPPPDRGGTGPSDAPAATGAWENGVPKASGEEGGALVARVDRAAWIG